MWWIVYHIFVLQIYKKNRTVDKPNSAIFQGFLQYIQILKSVVLKTAGRAYSYSVSANAKRRRLAPGQPHLFNYAKWAYRAANTEHGGRSNRKEQNTIRHDKRREDSALPAKLQSKSIWQQKSQEAKHTNGGAHRAHPPHDRRAKGVRGVYPPPCPNLQPCYLLPN